MRHSNDPTGDDPPEVETIHDVRDWYSDPNNIGLPPGVNWLDPVNETILLPNGERWRYYVGINDWRRV